MAQFRAHLQKALDITEPNDYQGVLELTKAYFHVKIDSNPVKYLGAKFYSSDRKPQYFVFLYMPFGLSSAVHCLTKLTKPIIAKIQSLVIRYSQFIDDGKVLAPTKEECSRNLQSVFDILEQVS